VFAQIIPELFPGKQVSDIVAGLVSLTPETLAQLLIRALIVVPGHIVGTAALILDTGREKLESLTPKELADVIKEYWAMNDMTDFFADVSGLIKRRLPTLTSGSSSGSPSANPSASARRTSSRATTSTNS
jgi:hypothetical protein